MTTCDRPVSGRTRGSSSPLLCLSCSTVQIVADVDGSTCSCARGAARAGRRRRARGSRRRRQWDARAPGRLWSAPSRVAVVQPRVPQADRAHESARTEATGDGVTGDGVTGDGVAGDRATRDGEGEANEVAAREAA